MGDNPVADILGAAATGMQTAWFRGPLDWPADQSSNPGPTIDRLGDLLDLLDREDWRPSNGIKYVTARDEEAEQP